MTPPFETARLLAWYDAERRAMPWRDEVSPYRTWVSEIMLQQTQVDVVRDYFTRFIARFPDVQALAAADEASVLSLWAGLGYYSRARNLHKAARLMVANGGLPKTADGWAALPGIGRYTLGAIRSIAYGEPLPVVDGNVIRVLSRVFGLAVQRGNPAHEKQLWAHATALVEGDALARARPGDFNQALMELGATVCSTDNPKCGRCPLRARCAALASGDATRYPLPKAKVKRKRVELLAAWVERRGRVLLVARPARGLWAGMWALPAVQGDRHAASALQTLLTGLGARDVKVGVALGSCERALTHRDVRLSLRSVRATGALAGKWVSRTALDEAGMPAAFCALVDSAQGKQRTKKTA